MFRGATTISLDAKGRVAIPTRYRDELVDCCERQLVLTVAVNEKGKGEPGCLWLYPLPEWEALEQTINKLPTLNKIANRLRRFVIGNASECEMDNQGRLLLPEHLRVYADLDKQVVLVGQLKKFEIWNEELWRRNVDDWMEDGDDTEGLEQLGALSF